MPLFTVEHNHYLHDCKTDNKLDEVLKGIAEIKHEINTLKDETKKLLALKDKLASETAQLQHAIDGQK